MGDISSKIINNICLTIAVKIHIFDNTNQLIIMKNVPLKVIPKNSQIALITGASSGIGKAFATRFGDGNEIPLAIGVDYRQPRSPDDSGIHLSRSDGQPRATGQRTR